MSQVVTIESVLEAFIDDERHRVSARTLQNYENIIDLLRHSLNGYAYESLDAADAKRFEEALEAGDEAAFCHLFGPEHILDHVREFLGYFMVRKVMGSQELLRSSGTVTKKLAAWLYEQGYVSEDERDLAVDQGARAARDLPRAERLATLLYNERAKIPGFDPDALDEEDILEGQFTIERIEPGTLYFSEVVGPLAVSEQASALAKVGWEVYVSLIRIAGIWWLNEVGNVYSM